MIRTEKINETGNIEKVYVMKPGEKVRVRKLEWSIDEPIHTHEFFEMVYISLGSARHFINGTEYDVKKGDLLFINFGQSHSFLVDGKLHYYNIGIDPEFFGSELINSENAFELLSLSVFEEFRNAVNPSKPLITFNGNEIIRFEFLLDEMIREQKENELGKDVLVRSFLTAIMVYVFRKMAAEGIEAKGKYRHIHADILEYIAQNCNEKLTLDNLAERCFYNPCYFSRLFREIYGITVSDYIQKVRIDKSCYMLVHSRRSIDEISQMVGYEDKTNFYKFFRKHVGMTPAEYRKRGKHKIF